MEMIPICNICNKPHYWPEKKEDRCICDNHSNFHYWTWIPTKKLSIKTVKITKLSIIINKLKQEKDFNKLVTQDLLLSILEAIENDLNLI